MKSRRDRTVKSQTWLFLIHQIPPKPDSFRVKVWRAIQKAGALSIKNSVYALPENDRSHKVMTSLAAQIREGGGEAMITSGVIIEGFDSEHAIRRYNQAIDTEYRAWIKEMKKIEDKLTQKRALKNETSMELVHELGRIESSLQALGLRNHFDSEGETIAVSLLSEIKAKLKALSPAPIKNSEHHNSKELRQKDFLAKTWVTRQGAKVDRLASAWLIHREIDPKANFKFINMDHYRHKSGELRFDVFGGEFTHEGDLCTFEVLLKRFGIKDSRLKKISEIIHDLDIEDQKYQHPEAEGIKKLLQGIIKIEKEDHVRVERASILFEQFYGAL
ncbi:MAG: chromate resistance protein [Bdellovibrionales bacterium]|nr:chromate resistance protein [Bdellovibrionales bacterium]